MANRTQIICLHEGKKGHSTDPIFINRLIRSLKPTWIRPHPGNNVIRLIDCGGRDDVITRMPSELKLCINAGGDTTLMVWADLDDNMTDGEELKKRFRIEAQNSGIGPDDFERVVFIFAKDRIENWIEFLMTGDTDESREGPRVSDRIAAEAAKKLAKRCQQATDSSLPPSLQWSCRNWHKLVERMKTS